MAVNYYGPYDSSGTAGFNLSAITVGSKLCAYWVGSHLYIVEVTST